MRGQGLRGENQQRDPAVKSGGEGCEKRSTTPAVKSRNCHFVDTRCSALVFPCAPDCVGCERRYGRREQKEDGEKEQGNGRRRGSPPLVASSEDEGPLDRFAAACVPHPDGGFACAPSLAVTLLRRGDEACMPRERGGGGGYALYRDARGQTSGA
eukprot:scaffold28701_cov101-Isochrysis_galbana.AAC.3